MARRLLRARAIGSRLRPTGWKWTPACWPTLIVSAREKAYSASTLPSYAGVARNTLRIGRLQRLDTSDHLLHALEHDREQPVRGRLQAVRLGIVDEIEDIAQAQLVLQRREFLGDEADVFLADNGTVPHVPGEANGAHLLEQVDAKGEIGNVGLVTGVRERRNRRLLAAQGGDR